MPTEAEDAAAVAAQAQAEAEAAAKAAEDATLGEGGKKALESEREARKVAEKRFKAAEEALAAERQKSMTDSEKAVSEAKASGRAEVSVEYGVKLARATFIAEAAKRNSNFDSAAIIDDLNLAKFIGDNGELDEVSISAAVERLIPEDTGKPRSLDLGGKGATPRGVIDMNSHIRAAAGRS